MFDSPLMGKRVMMVGAVVIVDVTIEAELRRAGARTIAACHSPAESVATYVQEKPDLVLIGITPSSLAESIDAIQKMTADDAACVAAIIHNVDIEDERRLRDVGATAIFKKPFTAADLIPALEETFRQHLSRR